MPHQRRRSPVPASPRAVGLVATGGAAGALARAAVAGALPHDPGQWPWWTLVVNTTGGAALGALVVLLPGPGRSDARLVLGTGLLGGWTTFSALSVDVVELVRAGRAATATAYLAVSLVLLLGATAAGAWGCRRAVARR